MGITEVPREFATTTAASIFTQLHLLLFENPQYRPLVRRVWENLEFRELSGAMAVEQKASSLLENGQREEAQALLNGFTKSNCDLALKTAGRLVEKITKETDWTVAK